MSRTFLPSSPLTTFLSAATLLFAASLSAEPETSAWTDASLLRFDSAHEAFVHLAENPGERVRFARLGAALTLLDPGSRKLEQATQQLEALVAQNAGDEPGIAAAFALARIAQWHEYPARPSTALAAYDALAAQHPSHPLGQLALIKALAIRLYEDGTLAEKVGRWRSMEALEEQLPDPALRSDYHQIMAVAGARFGVSPDARLRHLVAAVTLGIHRFKARKDFLLATAETARACGQRALALRYYELFLEQARQDERGSLVQRRYEAYRQEGAGP